MAARWCRWSLALELRTWFADELAAAAAGLVGICNEFQVLVKAGLLPGPIDAARAVALTENAQGRFECRWVTLQVDPRVALAGSAPWAAPFAARSPVRASAGAR